jgi:hypothetical protein
MLSGLIGSVDLSVRHAVTFNIKPSASVRLLYRDWHNALHDKITVKSTRLNDFAAKLLIDRFYYFAGSDFTVFSLVGFDAVSGAAVDSVDVLFSLDSLLDAVSDVEPGFLPE